MVDVRDAGVQDAPDIARLLGQLGYPSTAAEVAERLTYWSADPHSRVLLAIASGEVVGCLSLHAVPYLEKTGRWARVESLVVDASARGSGTGRLLVTAAEAIAGQWGCLVVEVTSRRTRRDAHAFYQRLGYEDSCEHSGRFLKPLS